MDSKQRIFFFFFLGGGGPVLYMVYYSLARDVAVSVNTTYKVGCWIIMSCVIKPGCTHGIIVSLWLIYYIQCGFSISYLSILGIVDHDRFNISQTFIFLFNFNVQCHAVPFIYITVFQEDSKQGSVVGRWVGRSVGS